MVTKYKAAKILGVSPATIQRMVDRGELGEPVRSDDGTYQFSETELTQWLEEHRPEDAPADPTVQSEALGVLQEAKALFKAAQQSLTWLVSEQQQIVTALHTQLKEGLQGWATAVREEQASRLEAQIVAGQEERKNKAVDAVLEAGPRIVSQSIEAGIGARLAKRVAGLSDEHWSVLRDGAKDLLGVTDEEMTQLEKLRASKESE